MKIPSVNNTDMRQYVLNCQPFNGSPNKHSRNGFSLSGRLINHLYVVYSYGYWPLYVCDTRHPGGLWFVNAHKYSSTTSKHGAQAYPTGKDCMPLPTDELTALIDEARKAL